MGNCARCGESASHQNVGALHSEDISLCSTCFTDWRKLGEDIRLRFVDTLTQAQKKFLGETEPESEPEITITEVEDFEIESWATSPETVPNIPPSEAIEFDQTDPYDSDV